MAETLHATSLQRPKCYISGPITGREHADYLREFWRAARYVENLGYEAVNPCELNHADHDQSWESFMRVDLKALMDCEAICLLPEWHRSVGAKAEFHLAQVLGMDVVMPDNGPDIVIEALIEQDILDDINIPHRAFQH